VAAQQLPFNDAQLEDLAKAAQGSEGRLGRELSRALREAGSQFDDRSPRARLAIWFAGLGEDEPKLRRVLEWAAACGEYVPVLPLLAAAELSQADAERFIDRIDDELCGESATLPLFEDVAYRHPGFPGLSVYRFRDRDLHLALLDQVDAAAQQNAERELLQFLSTRLAQATRSLAQLFINLTERVQFELSAGPRQRSRLWVGVAEQADLQALLTADVTAGRLPADALLRTSLQDQALPPTARLALLEAAATKEAELPHERRVMLASLRTELLAALGRIPEALASAEQGLAVLSAQQPEPIGLRGLLLFLSANCHRRLGQWDRALAFFQKAADEASKPRPDGSVDYQNWGVCLAEAGHCHAERQEWAEAAKLLREGIATLGKVPADGAVRDQQIKQLEHNLAVCEAKLQESAAAPG
jgi:tetratricopeptide (TPR) repeat protein